MPPRDEDVQDSHQQERRNRDTEESLGGSQVLDRQLRILPYHEALKHTEVREGHQHRHPNPGESGRQRGWTRGDVGRVLEQAR